MGFQVLVNSPDGPSCFDAPQEWTAAQLREWIKAAGFRAYAPGGAVVGVQVVEFQGSEGKRIYTPLRDGFLLGTVEQAFAKLNGDGFRACNTAVAVEQPPTGDALSPDPAPPKTEHSSIKQASDAEPDLPCAPLRHLRNEQRR